MSSLNNLLYCQCETKFSIEPHGDELVLYVGRCPHRHGLNLFTISDVAANCDLDSILGKLNEESKERQVDKWISVKDMLPKPAGEWVLVCADGAQNCVGYTLLHGFEDWCHSARGGLNIDFDKITHWMRLPESPKVEA